MPATKLDSPIFLNARSGTRRFDHISKGAGMWCVHEGDTPEESENILECPISFADNAKQALRIIKYMVVMMNMTYDAGAKAGGEVAREEIRRAIGVL